MTVSITPDDIKENERHEVLGPAYFASRRIAQSIMRGADESPFKVVVDKVIDELRLEIYSYVESNLLLDLELNIQGHLYRMVDDTVKALLTGEAWAMERYPLSKHYDADKIREAICKQGGEKLKSARIADLEKQVATLREHLSYRS